MCTKSTLRAGAQGRPSARLEKAAATRYASAVAQTGRFLLLAGAMLALAGGLFLLGDKLGFGRLPGDLVWRRKGVTVVFPLATSIVLSVILTLLVNLFLRRK